MVANRTAADEYREIAGRFTAVVDGVPDLATWHRRSPVPEWTARDVVGHLVTWFPAFLESGADVTVAPGPGIEEHPAAAWHALDDRVRALLDDPASGGVTLDNPHIGALPLPAAIDRFFTTDVFMHTWDLARATGQDETLDPQRCASLLEQLEPLDELLRSSGQFGPRVEVADDADAQTRMLAFIGRDPH